MAPRNALTERDWETLKSCLHPDVHYEDVPTEDFALNYEEIKVTYTENDNKGKKKGNVEYSWKVEEAEA